MLSHVQHEPPHSDPIGPSDTSADDITIRVASECQAIFRIVRPDDPPQRPLSSTLFHVPPFPSVDAIDPSIKLYKKREEMDADIIEMLLCLDWKINLLIKVLSPIRDEALYPYRAVLTILSMHQMTIQTAQPLVIGTALEFQFILPVLPFREIFFRGAVVALSETPDEYEIAITTSDWDESDREHLICYMVKRQFQLKRSQKHLPSAQQAQGGG